MTYAIWDLVEDFRNTFGHLDFQKAMKESPCSAVASPYLFSK